MLSKHYILLPIYQINKFGLEFLVLDRSFSKSKLHCLLVALLLGAK